jgi:hypothetical protein
MNPREGREMAYPGEKVERNRRIREESAKGRTHADIGREFGITKERVRQIAGPSQRPIIPTEERTCPKCGATHRRKVTSPTGHCSFACGRGYGGTRAIARSVLINRLRGLANRLGRTPSIYDINADPETPFHMTYVRRFGSIRAAQLAAGLEPNGVGGAGHRTRNGSA